MAYDPMQIDERFMRGGSLYQAPDESKNDPSNYGAWKAQQDSKPWLEKAWNTVTSPVRQLGTLFKGPGRPIVDDTGRPLQDYSPAQSSPLGQQTQQTAGSQMAPINDKVWEMVNANNPNSQFVLDEQRKRYSALTDPNNPALRRGAQLAGESAMAAARRAGIRGGYGVHAGEQSYNKAYQDQYLQRQQMAQQPLNAISAQSQADRDFVMRGVQLLAGNKLQEMGVDMEKFKLLLEDERYRGELKLALEQRNWDRVWQVVNTGLKVVGMAAGGGGGAGAGKAGF